MLFDSLLRWMATSCLDLACLSSRDGDFRLEVGGIWLPGLRYLS